MNREQAIAYKEVHDKCGMEVLRKLTPDMSDETRAVMLEWAENGGIVEYDPYRVWGANANPSFIAHFNWRLRHEPPRMAFVEGQGGRYEYPESLKEQGKLETVWVADGFRVWRAFSLDAVQRAIRHGIAHASHEAAEAHRRAEILARGGEV